MPVEPRDLTQNWCREGASLSDATSQIPAETHREREAEFAAEANDEGRTAAYLQAFTGLRPHLEDTNGRQGAVDLILEDAGRTDGIVEVTSTRDGGFLRNTAQLRHLIDQIDQGYLGSGSWALGFEYGWTMPANRELTNFGGELSASLNEVDGSGIDENASPVTIGPNILAYRVPSQGAGTVHIASWSTNTPNSPDAPYLDRLSTYLATSDLIAKKISKLTVERARLGQFANTFT
jgi:hypothetical protein